MFESNTTCEYLKHASCVEGVREDYNKTSSGATFAIFEKRIACK